LKNYIVVDRVSVVVGDWRVAEGVNDNMSVGEVLEALFKSIISSQENLKLNNMRENF